MKSPELAAPQAISDLRAANTVDGVMLTWSRPRQYVDGTTLDTLGRFVVERAEAAVPGAFATITTLEVNDRERFRQTRTFRYLDHGPVVGSAYLYRVTAGTTDGYFSAPSNTAVVQREVPPENIRENSPPKTP